MNIKFLFFISFFTKILLKEEEDLDFELDEDKKNKSDINDLKKKEGYYPGNKIYNLMDYDFDEKIRNGRIHRWFILFYSKTCGHCNRARKEIAKLFNQYKKDEILRFAQIEAYENTLTNVRFNITGVPYIILVENDSMIELDKYPNLKNLKDFVQANFTEIKSELQIFPRRVKFAYVAWFIFKQNIQGLTRSFNKFLKKIGISFQFKPWAFLISVILITISTCTGFIRFCMYCCCNDEEFEKEWREIQKKYKEQREKEGYQNYEGEEEEYEGEEPEYIELEEGEEEEDDVEGQDDKKDLKKKTKEQIEEELKKKENEKENKDNLNKQKENEDTQKDKKEKKE